jgi:hypothetical protein
MVVRPARSGRLGLADDQPVTDATDRRSDPQHAGVEADPVPTQRQCLTLAQTGRRDQHERRVILRHLSGY